MGRQSIAHVLVSWRSGLTGRPSDKDLKELARLLHIVVSTEKKAERSQTWINLNVEIVARLLKEKNATVVLNIFLESLTSVPYWVQKCLQHIQEVGYTQGFADGKAKGLGLR